LDRQCGRSAFTQPQTGTLQPTLSGPCRTVLLLQVPADIARAASLARDVGAHMHHPGWAGFGGEQRVEGDHAVDVGRRDPEPYPDIVQRPGTDPAHPVVDRVYDLQQQV